MSIAHPLASRAACLSAALLVLGACSAGSGSTTQETGSTGSKLGGSAKNATCTNTEVSAPRTGNDATCDACMLENCPAEANAMVGSDPNAFGGACGAHQQCVCDCRASDDACMTACKTSAECASALGAALECMKAKCKSAGC
ncbi:MAG: hypothetical protein JST00_00375 [Deltaproteobacteria bacterium]|nr:hypothetical protein [Deltaproteobacteria bacterium]